MRLSIIAKFKTNVTRGTPFLLQAEQKSGNSASKDSITHLPGYVRLLVYDQNTQMKIKGVPRPEFSDDGSLVLASLVRDAIDEYFLVAFKSSCYYVVKLQTSS